MLATERQLDFIQGLILRKKSEYKILENLFDKYKGEGFNLYIDFRNNIMSKMQDMTSYEAQCLIDVLFKEDNGYAGNKIKRVREILHKYL